MTRRRGEPTRPDRGSPDARADASTRRPDATSPCPPGATARRHRPTPPPDCYRPLLPPTATAHCHRPLPPPTASCRPVPRRSPSTSDLSPIVSDKTRHPLSPGYVTDDSRGTQTGQAADRVTSQTIRRDPDRARGPGTSQTIGDPTRHRRTGLRHRRFERDPDPAPAGPGYVTDDSRGTQTGQAPAAWSRHGRFGGRQAVNSSGANGVATSARISCITCAARPSQVVGGPTR